MSNKSRDIAAIQIQLDLAWKARDPQAAAEAIAKADKLQDYAMDYANSIGFIPEYYASSIRVHLPE
jgi:hypothetical protein